MAQPYNWAAAFTAFVGGSEIEEVATVFGIPEGNVRKRASEERWIGLKSKIIAQSQAMVIANQEGAQLPMSQSGDQKDLLPPEVRARLKLISHNREVQYGRAVKMGEELDRILQGIKDGTYKVGKHISVPKVGPMWVEAAPGPADLV